MKPIGILVAATAFIFGGCTTASVCGVVEDMRCQPIHNVMNAPVIAPAGKIMSVDEVSKTIQRAGAALGWDMRPEAPGRIAGTLKLRTHVAIVDIEHDSKSYSIKYRDSSNLAANKGMIHRFYNGWIQHLNDGIQTQLKLP